MSTMLVIGIVVLSIVCVSLVVVLFNKKSKKEQVHYESKSNFKTLKISDIKIPLKIEKMDYNSLYKACKIVFESFKSLDYANNQASRLDKIEWHTWQVSLIMAMIKADKASFVPINKELFHHSITKLDRKSRIALTQKVLDKYNNYININKSRNELSDDIYWSSKEVTILFYYMARS